MTRYVKGDGWLLAAIIAAAWLAYAFVQWCETSEMTGRELFRYMMGG